MIQLTQEQIDELKYQYISAEINARFDWNTDVAGNSYNADGISAAYGDALNTIGILTPKITEELVREHLESVGEDPDDYTISDYID